MPSRDRTQTPTGHREIHTGVADSCAAAITTKLEVQQTSGHQSSDQCYVLLLILLAAATLLMLGPTAYCGFGDNQVELAKGYRQRAHGSTSTQCVESCQVTDHDSSIHGALNADERNLRRDVLSSSINGLLVMSASVLSGIAIELPGSVIFAISTSNLLASAFASGFSKYMLDSSRDEFASNQLRLEYEEVRTIPTDEVNEMVCHYQKRGLSEEDARKVAGILSKYEDYWVRHMVSEELGVELPRGQDDIRMSGFAASLSFIAFGLVPVLGVAVPRCYQRYLNCDMRQIEQFSFSTLVVLGISAAALFGLGVMLSEVTGCQCTFKNGLWLLLGGTFASVCAFVGTNVLAEFNLIGTSTVHTSRSQGSCFASEGTRKPNATDSKAMGSADVCAWKYFKDRFWWCLSLLWIGVSFIIFVTEHVQKMGFECLRVFAFGWLTCITTGLGVVPFMFVSASGITDHMLAIANTCASGMMLSASAGMVLEAHDHSGIGDWQVFAGLLAGGLFIRASQHVLGDEEEAGVEALHGALMERRHLRKAMLIFTVMFCHSAAEGIAVGVAFDKQVHAQFGFYISLLLAIHNMPEGLAVALVLVPRGVSIRMASFIATLTSIPQPLLALTSFLFVDAFQFLLPLGLSFAAGAMVYVSLHELLQEAAEQLGRWRTFWITSSSFVLMLLVQVTLQRLTGVST